MSPTHDDLAPMLDAKEVARLLGVSLKAVYRDGIPGLHPVRIGRRVRFRRRDVERVMNGEAARPDDDPAVEALVDRLAEATWTTAHEVLDEDEAGRLIAVLGDEWSAILEGSD